jgi:hypothetical protein
VLGRPAVQTPGLVPRVRRTSGLPQVTNIRAGSLATSVLAPAATLWFHAYHQRTSRCPYRSVPPMGHTPSKLYPNSVAERISIDLQSVC